MKIGERLKQLRKEKGITQKVISDHLGIRANTYSQYENNFRNPTYDIVEKLVAFFDVDYNSIFDRKAYEYGELDETRILFDKYLKLKFGIITCNKNYQTAVARKDTEEVNRLKQIIDDDSDEHNKVAKRILEILLEESFHRNQ